MVTKTKAQSAVTYPTPDGTIVFNFTVSSADVAHGYQEVIKEYARTVEIKGFRKGKAPIHLVEQSLDKNKVYSHVLEHVIPPAYSAALEKNGYRPLIDPRLTPISMEEGKDWEFKAETAATPEIELGNYKKYIAEAIKTAPKPEKPKEGEKAADEKDTKLTVALDALLKNAKIAVSQLLIEEEAKSALGKLMNQLAALKLTVDDYAKSIKKSREELVKEYEKTAETNLKVEFLLSAVVKDLKPTVEEKDPYKKYAAERRAALDFISGL